MQSLFRLEVFYQGAQIIVCASGRMTNIARGTHTLVNSRISKPTRKRVRRAPVLCSRRVRCFKSARLL